MPSFATLIDANRKVREFGMDAERHLETAPLLALVRARQAFEAFLNRNCDDRSLTAAGFLTEWQFVIHGRFNIDAARERQAAAAALTFVFDKAKPAKATARWEYPVFADRVDDFARLQLAYSDLLDRVDSKDAPSKDDANGELEKLRKRVRSQSDRLDEAERDILALIAAITVLAIENHEGAEPSEEPSETSALLARAASAPGELHRLWVWYTVRRCIALTNSFDFERAWAQLESIVQPYRADTWLKDELMGRALGSTGQAAGFIARTQREPIYVDRALECFAAAAQAFALPDDVERQQSYRIHALCEGVILGMDHLRDDLDAHLRAFEPRVRDWLAGRRDGPRFDYPLAAWLKAHHVLRRPVPSHGALVQSWNELPGRTTPDNNLHGPLLAAGWLGVTTPAGQGVARAIRISVQEVSKSAGEPTMQFIAASFSAHFAWRESGSLNFQALTAKLPLTNSAQRWWGTPGWQGWIAAQAGPGGLGPIMAVPFNFA